MLSNLFKSEFKQNILKLYGYIIGHLKKTLCTFLARVQLLKI